MDLNRDAMLVGLHIAAWPGRLYDRQASDHVAVAHEANTSAGRYNKRLLAQQGRPVHVQHGFSPPLRGSPGSRPGSR